MNTNPLGNSFTGLEVGSTEYRKKYDKPKTTFEYINVKWIVNTPPQK